METFVKDRMDRRCRHPAVEQARKRLPKNLQWALEHGSVK